MALSHIPILIARSLASQLDPADQAHLRAATGFVELAMPLEADEELDRITPEKRALPAVQAVRLLVYLLSERWESAAVLARHFAREIEPTNAQWWISWAYAARRAESLQAAQAILLSCEPLLHSQEPTINFNLACYAAQLGELKEAKAWLRKAIGLDARMKLRALEEPDLAPIW